MENRTHRSRANARPLVALAVCTGLIGCAGEGTGPDPDPTPDRPRATTVEVVSGAAQLSLAGTPLPDPVVIRVRDQDGLPIAAIPVSVRPSGNGRVALGRANTDFDGTAGAVWTLGDQVGEQTLRFDVPGIAEPLVMSAEGALLDAVDVLRVDALPGGSVGLLASGRTHYGDVMDYDVLVTETEGAFGDFRAGAPRSELAVLTRFGAPRLVPNPWTDGIDEVEVEVSTPIEVPLTIRVLQAPFEATLETVEAELEYAREVYESEGLGVVFTDVEIVDATGIEDTDELKDFLCSERTALESAVGHDDDRLNVYYLTTVDGSTSRGQSCIIGGNFVAMASFAGDDLLSHEVGHMLGLFHVDGQSGFSQTNVMHSASNTRRFLTEGQIFRAHWNTNSSMATLGISPGELTRTCGAQYDPSNCPTVDVRIFEDALSAGGPADGASATGGGGYGLSPLERALARRCSSGGDPEAFPEGVRVDDLVAVYRDRTRPRDVREEALRLIALSGTAGAGAVLEEALQREPEVFGGVVRWGRDVLRRR